MATISIRRLPTQKRASVLNARVDLVELHPVLLAQACDLFLELGGLALKVRLVLVNGFAERVKNVDLVFVNERDWRGQ